MNHTEPVQARVVPDFEQATQPGDIVLFKTPYFGFACPCGCGRHYSIPLEGAPNAKGWAWDQNRQKPTLAPSIRQLNGCRWHGHLKGGVWEPCGDSGQAI